MGKVLPILATPSAGPMLKDGTEPWFCLELYFVFDAFHVARRRSAGLCSFFHSRRTALESTGADRIAPHACAGGVAPSPPSLASPGIGRSLPLALRTHPVASHRSVVAGSQLLPRLLRPSIFRVPRLAAAYNSGATLPPPVLDRSRHSDLGPCDAHHRTDGCRNFSRAFLTVIA